jgi:hypothetical protein
MNTFLPYPDFDRSARCLDDRRLGKQRVEALQILNALRRGHGGWIHHPAVLMWSGYEDALRLYMNSCIREWISRGFVNRMPLAEVEHPVTLPPWLGDRGFHRSHRSSLLRKDPSFYGRYGWKVPPDLPYVWPGAADTP